MLGEQEATGIVRAAFPDSRIEKPIDYRGVFLFQVFGSDPLEGDQDPFFSVHKQTGELRDYSVITDGNPKEIEKLFFINQRTK